MRFLYLLLVCCGLSQSVVAQSAKHKADYYILADSSKRYPAAIKLVELDKIAIQEPAGQKHTLHAGSIAQFQSKGHHYYTISNFELKPGDPNSRVRYGFAELLDSGQVSLLRYDYSGMKMGLTVVSGMPLPGVGHGTVSLYVLRLAASPQVAVVPADGLFHDGPRFQAALRPFLAARPDLLAPLLERSFNVEDVPDIVRALNTNQPFVKTTGPVGIE